MTSLKLQVLAVQILLTLLHWKRGGLRVEITGMFPFIQRIQLKVLMCKEGGTSTEFLSWPGGESKVGGFLLQLF